MGSENQHVRKPDPVVLAFCALTLISCLGAAGQQARQRAKDMVCLANLQQWGVLFGAYTDDHDGNFNPGWNVGETTLWMNALRPYYQDQWSLLLCPAATEMADNGTRSGTFSAWYRNTTTPGGGTHRYVSSYGINSWTNCMTYDRGWKQWEWFWRTTRDVQGTSAIPVFADSTWHDAWPTETDGPIDQPFGFGWGNMGTTHEMNHFCIVRHDGSVNVLFMDWSARAVGLKELWTLKWYRRFDTAGPWTRAGGVQPNDWPAWMRGFKDY